MNKFDGFVKSPSSRQAGISQAQAALRFILALLNSRCARRRSRFNRVNHCGVLLCTPHSSRFARLASGAFYCAVHFDDFLRGRQFYPLKFLVLLFICAGAGCGYQIRANGEPVGITIQNLAIPLFTSTSSEMGFEALFTRVIREEFISHAKVPLVPEERASVVLIGRIYDIGTDPIGYDDTGGFTVTSTRRIRVRLDVQMVDKTRGKIIWHDKSMEERTSFQVGTDPIGTQLERQQALETLARRVARKIYQRSVERF
jgi:hypothetical protein